MEQIIKREAIILAVAGHYFSRAHRSRGAHPVPTADGLAAASAAGGQAWEDVLDDAASAVDHLVSAEGAWTHLVIDTDGVERIATETVDLDMLTEASATATALLDLGAAGHWALLHAMSEVDRQYRAAAWHQGADAFREALAAERGLAD